jgi:two-component system chemotaxis sensor kinase CheA
MDPADYIPLFVAECRDYIQSINIALVQLELDSSDASALEVVQRLVHSLKGMTATMGYHAVAQLLHELEDVMVVAVQPGNPMQAEALELALAAVDQLEEAIDAVEADGAVPEADATLLERMRAMAERVLSEDDGTDTTAEAEPEQASVSAPPRHVADRTAESATADPVLATEPTAVVVRLAEDTTMRGARAYTILAAAGRMGTVLTSVPAMDELEGFDGLVVAVALVTDMDARQIASVLAELPDVTEVDLPGAAEAALAPAVRHAVPAAPVAAGPPDEPTAVAAPETASEADHPARPAQTRSEGARTLRVDAERLDQLMHLMGEVVVDRTQLEASVDPVGHPAIAAQLQRLIRSTQALQSMVMQVRMIPLEAVFARFPRMVRDLSTRLDKQVTFTMDGADTEVDRSIVDMVFDPLAHLVRNALDHGIETTEQRVRRGKPATARVRLFARTTAGKVVVGVSDDGKGIDVRAVAARAVERDLIDQTTAAELTQEDAIELLFRPGFSTALTTTDISGRGVGMDAVRSAVRAMGGDVHVSSEPGVGTTSEIHLPLTLAIVSVLLADAPNGTVAIPTDRVERIVRLRDVTARDVGNGKVVVIDGDVIPSVPIAAIVGADPASAERTAHAIVVRAGGRDVAITVPRVNGSRELVARALPSSVAGQGMFSGGGQLPDGEIALIVDCDAIRTTSLPSLTTSKAVAG